GRGGEDVAHFYSSNGTWNDFAATNTSSIAGYIVEYGGLSTDFSDKPEAANLKITVTPVNDAPTLLAPTSLSVIDTESWDSFNDESGALSAQDIDTDALLTYSIVGGSAVDGMQVIDGTYGRLVLDPSTGSYSYAADPYAINALSTSVTDSFTLKVTDQHNAAATQTLTVNITGVDDKAVIGGAASTAVYTENGSTVILDPTLTLTDADGSDYGSASLLISTTANGEAADQLSIATVGGISVSGSNVSYNGTLIGSIVSTKTGVDGTDLEVSISSGSSIEAVEALARAISFSSTSEDPSESNRTLVFTLTDPSARVLTKSATVSVGAANDAPEIDLGSASWVTEKTTANTDASFSLTGVQISDVDDTTVSVTLSVKLDTTVSPAVPYGQLSILTNVSGGLTASDFSDGTVSGDAVTGSTLTIKAGTDISRINTTLAASGGLIYSATETYDAIEPGPDLVTITATDSSSAESALTKQVIVAPEAPSADSRNLFTTEEQDLSLDVLSFVTTTSGNEGSFVYGTGTVGGSITAFSGNAIYAPTDLDGNGSADDVIGYTLYSSEDSSVVAGELKFATTGQYLSAAAKDAAFIFTPDADFEGYTEFYYQYSETGSTPADVAQVRIFVSGVNDAPVVTISGTPVIDEDTSLTFAANGAQTITLDDLDAESSSIMQLTLRAENGEISLATTSGISVVSGALDSSFVKIRGSFADLQSAVDGLVYSPNADFNGTDTLSLRLDDLGNSGEGGAQYHEVSKLITVNAVNDAPVLTTPSSASLQEDGTLFFGANEAQQILFADVDALSDTLMTLTLGVAEGVMELGNTSALTSVNGDGTASISITGTKAALRAALEGLSYSPDLNFNGIDTLAISLSDAGATGSGGVLTDTKTIALTVNAVNDAPTLNLVSSVSTDEDHSFTFAAGNITLSDIDLGSGDMQLTLNVSNGSLTLASTAGLTFVNGTADGDASIIVSGSRAALQAAVDELVYAPNSNFNGSESLAVTLEDLGNTGNGGNLSVTDTITINVAAVNDQPLVTAPLLAGVAEDTVLSFTGNSAITLADLDATSTSVMSLLVEVTNGSLSLANINQLSVIEGANNAKLVKVQGTLSQLQTAIAGLTYLPNAGYFGSDSLTVTLADKGDTGSGGALSDSATIAITIRSVNDVPVLTVADLTTTEDTTSVSATASVTDQDTEDSHSFSVTAIGAGEGSVSIDVSTGEYTFTPGDDFQYLAAGESATVTFDVTASDPFGASDTETVTVTVTGVNDSPVLSDPDNFSYSHAAPKAFDQTVQSASALATDVDSSDVLTYGILKDGVVSTSQTETLGTLSIDSSTGNYTFTPNDAAVYAQTQTVTQTFTLQVSDDASPAASVTKDVVVTVVGAPLTLGDDLTPEQIDQILGYYSGNIADVQLSQPISKAYTDILIKHIEKFDPNDLSFLMPLDDDLSAEQVQKVLEYYTGGNATTNFSSVDAYRDILIDNLEDFDSSDLSFLFPLDNQMTPAQVETILAYYTGGNATTDFSPIDDYQDILVDNLEDFDSTDLSFLFPLDNSLTPTQVETILAYYTGGNATTDFSPIGAYKDILVDNLEDFD
ncbi:MAG: tandem-95 repeat protein, partial [Gammaproteobacteria bacterium]|nr:tandem-95 repeat protein [Gammaproteobacteria bacterium]